VNLPGTFSFRWPHHSTHTARARRCRELITLVGGATAASVVRPLVVDWQDLHTLEAREREKAIATRCDEFDAKPIEFESLVAAIRRIVANPK